MEIFRKGHGIRLFLATALLVAAGYPLMAWFSMNLPWDFNLKGDTHERLSKDAVDAIKDEAPDMDRHHTFGAFIWEATEGIKDDARAHDGNGKQNTGDVEKYWKMVMNRYCSFRFIGVVSGKSDLGGGAYWYIGRLLHLVEDMAVPAHAYDIFHARGMNFDNFELNAGHRYRAGSTEVFHLDTTSPIDYYKACRDRTIEVLENELIAPPPGKHWSDYWEKGNYGPRDDIFPRRYPKSSKEENELLANQLSQARSHGAGFLLAASKALPPLVKNFTAEATPGDDGMYQVKIRFSVLENRKPEVTIFLTVAEGPDSILDNAGLTAGLPATLDPGEMLPFEKSFAMDWKVVASASESRTLNLRIRDFDGNDSPPASFTISFSSGQNSDLFSCKKPKGKKPKAK